MTDTQVNQVRVSGAVALLRLIGCLNLIFGVIGAILCWTTFAYQKVVEPYTVNYPLSGPKLETYTETVINPYAVGAGFGLLFEAFLVLALCLVIARIAEDTAEIKSMMAKEEPLNPKTVEAV